ncbi:MAG: PDZ domain-containing protein [Planctomycetes bacterium]|nr:PDZ domain-containing protein [Planctomycetota bacterium]
MIRNWMAVLAFCALGFPAPMGLAPGLDERVDAILGRAEKGSLAAICDAARELTELGVSAKAELKAKVTQDAARAASPAVRLAIGRALIELDEKDLARDTLLAVAQESAAPAATRLLAVQMLGVGDFSMDEAVVKLMKARLDAELDPIAKIATAKALYKVSTGDRPRAVKEMERALESERSDVRAQAALALAEAGSIEKALAVLKKLQHDPTPEGRIALAYIEKDKAARTIEAKLRKGNAHNVGRGGAGDDYAPSGDLDLLEEVLDKLTERHVAGNDYRTAELREELIEAAADGMMRRMDPHSNFFTQKEHERWNLDLQRDYGGIGAYVDQIGEERVFTITRPIYSGPAYEAGLRSRDQIWKVDGWETTGIKDINEIIARLKGPAGTPVTITVFRRGWTEPQEMQLHRERIVIPSVSYDMLPGEIGYIELATFARESPKEMVEALRALEKRGMKGLILDLRNDTGGFLEVAQVLVGVFCGEGKLVVRTEGPMPQDSQPYETPTIGINSFSDPKKLPMAAMINDVSASASEILAGCLKHYGRATLVGTHTYGKGSVQTPMSPSTRFERFTDQNGNGEWDTGEPFVDRNNNGKWDIGPYMKITTGRYFLPDGTTPDRQYDTNGIVLTQEIDGKRYIKGGIHPDALVDLHEPDLWKEQELAKLLSKSTDRRRATIFHGYLDDHYEANRDLFLKLAIGDRHDWSQYPGFNAFYDGLDTRLAKEDVRVYLRHYLRERVCDDRKQIFPGQGYFILGDYQEDNQLQAAIKSVLEQLGRKPVDIADYAAFDTKLVDAAAGDKAGATTDGGK